MHAPENAQVRQKCVSSPSSAIGLGGSGKRPVGFLRSMGNLHGSRGSNQAVVAGHGRYIHLREIFRDDTHTRPSTQWVPPVDDVAPRLARAAFCMPQKKARAGITADPCSHLAPEAGLEPATP